MYYDDITYLSHYNITVLNSNLMGCVIYNTHTMQQIARHAFYTTLSHEDINRHDATLACNVVALCFTVYEYLHIHSMLITVIVIVKLTMWY